MLKRLIGLMTAFAFTIFQPSKVDRMFEGTAARILRGRACGIVEHGVTEGAIVSDYLAGIAFVLTIMATETT